MGWRMYSLLAGVNQGPGTWPSLPSRVARPDTGGPRMEIELITIGTELLLGQVLDTHQQWLGQRLADSGYTLSRQVTVPDNGPAICGAVVAGADGGGAGWVGGAAVVLVGAWMLAFWLKERSR